jgi:hypothetical protein
MLSRIRVFAAVGLVCLASSGLGQEFGPKVGEYLILRIRTFHAKDWKVARQEYLKAVERAHSTDETEQDVIVAEDTAKHRLLALSWADKANFKSKVVHHTVPRLNNIQAAPKIEREFKIFAANNEPIKPKVGDAVVLFWPTVKKGDEAHVESLVKKNMFAMLKSDKDDRDSFAMRDLKNGQFFAVAIAHWADRDKRLVAKMDRQLKPHHKAPVKRETFRIILCHLE